MAFTPWSAKLAKVRFGSAGAAAGANGPTGGSFGPTVLTAKAWEVQERTDPADVSNFENVQGVSDWVATLIDLDVSITDSEYDFAVNVYDAPLQLRARTILATQLFLNDLSSPYWYIANMLVLGNPMSVQVRGTVKIPSIAGKGKGAFTYPTGNVATPS